MKKILLITTAVLGVFLASSCQKETAEAGDEEVTVNFTVALPGSDTKALISDGLSADIVYWAAFDENGGTIDGMNGSAEVKDKNASFDVVLVKNYTYKFVFWAQDSDCKAYDLSTFSKDGKIRISYQGDANDESRDAFYKQEDVMIQASGEVRTIRLYRPFAQINFLAADYKSVEEVEVHKSLRSTVSISGLPNVLNGLDGSVEGDATTELVAAAVPASPAYFTVNGTQYGWYSMNYILASSEKDLGLVTATFTHDKSDKPVHIAVPNVPYERNHRTNIIGNFLTGIAEVKVIVMEGFEDPSYDIDEEGNPIQ